MSTTANGHNPHALVGEVVEFFNPEAKGNILLVCEHASNVIPPYLNNLGLSETARTSHAAWDPGALNVAKTIATKLDLTVVAPTFSRLIYDCNRPPESPTAMPPKSEIYDIPGNVGLSEADRKSRADAYYHPYANALSDFVDARIKEGRQPAILTIHSFTPIYHGRKREVELGIIHDEDRRFADALLEVGPGLSNHIYKRNDPYGPEDGVTHTLKTHAISKGLQNAMIEIRNDLLFDENGQQEIADVLATCLSAIKDKLEN